MRQIQNYLYSKSHQSFYLSNIQINQHCYCDTILLVNQVHISTVELKNSNSKLIENILYFGWITVWVAY